MNDKALLTNAEIKFDIEINGCFSSDKVELHLIPVELNSQKVFFHINQNNQNSFVVTVSREKGEKLIFYLLENATKEKVILDSRSTTTLKLKISWKNISFPTLSIKGIIDFERVSYISPEMYLEFWSQLSKEDKSKYKSLIEKELHSPEIFIARKIEKIAKSTESFLSEIETL